MGKSSILAVVAFLAAIAFMISTIVVAVRLKDREDNINDLEKKLAKANANLTNSTKAKIELNADLAEVTKDNTKLKADLAKVTKDDTELQTLTQTQNEDLTKSKADLTKVTKELETYTVNPCDGAKKTFATILGGLENTDCFKNGSDGDGDVAITVPPQAGADVTLGVVGAYNVQGIFTEGQLPLEGLEDLLVPKPIMTPYSVEGLCPVNVHWHLGTEHRSEGQYDESGTGPTKVGKRRLDGSARQGGQCTLYDKDDEKFTKPFEWKHCDTHMEVGQTYEVHWPHSKLGKCGTRWQYQEPFYDGVTCDLSKIEPDRVTGKPILSQHVGVQAQIFVIVNDDDEKYYYPNLIGGMIVDGTADPPFGEDMAIYTGSTTGTSRNNIECSTWGPITWQVDRTCHMVSASSFDKMCKDMKGMADDMTIDLEAHGSREVVDDKLAIAQETPPN